MKASRFTQEMIDEYVRLGYWDDSLISDSWDRNAKRYPNAEAIIDEEKRVTWSEAKRQIDAIASALLELDIHRDDRIAIQLPNCVELFATRLACEKAGILAATLLPTFRHAEVTAILQQIKAVGIIIPDEFRKFDYVAMIREILPHVPTLRHLFVLGDDVPKEALSVREMAGRPFDESRLADALRERRFSAFETFQIATTTGTTGMPKCVEFASCVRQATGRVVAKRLKITRDDVLGACSPVIAGGCFNEAYRAAPLMGAKIVLAKYFTPEEILGLVERERITVIAAVPTAVIRVLDYPDFDKFDVSSLRVVKYGGSEMPRDRGAKIWEKFKVPGCPAYGGLDAGTISTSFVDDMREQLITTIGRPLDGAVVKLVDENNIEVPLGETGELLVKGAHCEPGFYNDPEATRETWQDGWFHTGDLASFDADGRLTIRGRRKDMILRGGQNIYPLEIEDLILRHPMVLKVAVVGIPDAEMGEKACACVVLRQGQTLSLSDLVRFFKEQNLAPFKIPERLEVFDDLPLAGGIKVDKKWLKQEVEQRAKSGER